MRKVVIKSAQQLSTMYIGEDTPKLEELAAGRRMVLVADSAIVDCLGDLLRGHDTILIPSGEANKNLAVLEGLWSEFYKRELDRDALVIGVGGGVVCDLAAFAAATYLRGVPYGSYATTLLAQVDASIGGKNGINFHDSKNIIGTIRQPEFCICNSAVLRSLPRSELSYGFSEVIKHAAIASMELFQFLEQNIEQAMTLKPEVIETVVFESIKIKAAIVEADQFERDERRKLNFGHTIGHAIELIHGIPHGEAVALGMIIESRVALQLELLKKEELARLDMLLKKFGLGGELELDKERILKAMRHDKKRSGDLIKMVLLEGIGRCRIESVEMSRIVDWERGLPARSIEVPLASSGLEARAPSQHKNIKIITPHTIRGTIIAPPSKSMMQRAVAAASLSSGVTRIYNPSFCDDSNAALKVASALGATITQNDNHITIQGRSKHVESILNCAESGLSLRMFSAIAALSEVELTMTGSGSLLKRPIGMIAEPLRRLGVSVVFSNNRLPIRIKGPIKSGEIEIDGGVTSQFLTGLLMALPLCKGDSTVYVSNLKSRPYISMTLEIIERFGIAVMTDPELTKFTIPGGQLYNGTELEIEGDWSAAAFFLVAGATSGEIRVKGLSEGSRQADRAILNPLIASGSALNWSAGDLVVSKPEKLKPFHFDATEAPDLFPALVVLAANCSGESTIRGVKRLSGKESDRGVILRSEFKKLGVEVKIEDDLMRVVGGRLGGGIIDPHGDHRIAMAGAIAGLSSSSSVQISDAKVVSKSYPNFFEVLESIL